MATIEQTNDALQAGFPPREDGSAWPYALTREETTTFSDSVTDLVAVLIPGYSDIPVTDDGHSDALWVRYQQAVATANEVQTLLTARATNDGLFAPSETSEDILTVIFQDRVQPLEDVAEWSNVVPLVLVDTDYAPFNERPAPEGNILWIRPGDENSYLTSLAEIGIIGFYINQGG